MKCFFTKPALLVFASLCLFACDDDDTTVRTQVEIDPATCTVPVGGTQTLTARISPPPAVGQDVVWSSANSAVATVDGGVVTGVSVGDAIITATVGDASATCKVTVVPQPVTGVTLDKETLTLEIEQTQTLVATVSPDNATDKTLVWSSDKLEVATVADGLVTAVNIGEATITVKAGDASATCVVTVVGRPVTGISLDKETLTLEIDQTETLVATVLPDNATDKTVVWTTSDEKIATVAEGLVTAVGAGEAVITAAAGDVTATCIVTVNAPAPKIGDYFYSDGTWSDGGLVSIEADGLNPVWAETKPAPVAGKTVIGIVCQTFPERIAQSDKDAGYTHGYVMATKIARDPEDTVDPDIVEWSKDFNFSCLKAAKSGATWYNNVNGYVETMTVKDEYGADLAAYMPAFHLVLNDFPSPAPASTSGWFLPSTGQLWDAVANFCGGEVAAAMKEWQTVTRDATVYCSDNTISYNPLERFNAMMAGVPAEDKDEQMQVDAGHAFASIWASTPYDEESACMFNFGDYWGRNLVECMTEWYDGECTVRPILAF